MLSLLKQFLAFTLIQTLKVRFRWIFIIINFLPLVLYYFLEFEAKDLFGFYIVETLVYCLVNYFGTIARLVFPIICLILVYLTVESIFNPENYSQRWISFLHYTTILVIFHTVYLFMMGERFYEIEDETFKRNMVIKFLVLFAIAIVGAIFQNVIGNDIAFLISMCIIKNIIDFYANFKLAK